MKYVVTQIRQIEVEAETPELAVAGVAAGNLIFSQDVPNVRRSQKPEEWPVWAKALQQFSTPDDKGIGDVVARMIGDEKSAKFKAWHLATFGRPCSCTERQERWNKQYPL